MEGPTPNVPQLEPPVTIEQLANDGKYMLDVPTNGMTEAGKREVKRAVRDEFGIYLPEDWEWEWVVRKGRYAGTFPKRVASLLYKQHDMKADPEALSRIGNIARRHTDMSEVRYLDVTRHFDWRAGDFGDNNSCFWGENNGARRLMQENGGHALRLWTYEQPETITRARDIYREYKTYHRMGRIGAARLLRDKYMQWASEGKYAEYKLDAPRWEGAARAWLMPWQDKWVLFNSYGEQAITMARILAQATVESYNRIHLTNNGRTAGLLWINSEMGYLIGPAEEIASVGAVDFGLDTSTYRCLCNQCGDLASGDYTSPDGYDICEYCYDNHVSYCEIGGHTVWHDDALTDPNGDIICPRHYDRNIIQCHDCNEDYFDHEIAYAQDSIARCGICHDRYLTEQEELEHA